MESVNVVFLVSDQFRQLEKCECVLFYAPSFRLCRNCFVLVPFSGSLAGRIKKERGTAGLGFNKDLDALFYYSEKHAYF